MTPPPLRIAFYSPADLNILDGSAIWVQAIAEVLDCGPEVEVALPLKAPERRDLLTRLLRRLKRVKIVDPLSEGRVDPWGLRSEDVLDILERMDRRAPFDVILLRSYRLCRLAVTRKRLRDRLWSAYVLEPELDLGAPEYLEDLAEIADGSRYLVVQSEEMRALLEATVPGAIGKTILLPPAISPVSPRADPTRPVPRLIYVGKFSPLYAVPLLIDFFEELRRSHSKLEFHIAGDKFQGQEANNDWARSLERALVKTPGITWHGGISRDAVERLLARGGIGINVWDDRYDLPMNNLVISTKSLDYCAVGLPVILNRTASHEAMLGRDYPLFLSRLEETPETLARVLSDADLYRQAAEQTWAASRPFTYPEVYRRLEPYLFGAREGRRGTDGTDLTLFDRPKLPEASLNLGVIADPSAVEAALGVLRILREADDRYRLIVLGDLGAEERHRIASADGLAGAVTMDAEPAGGMASWLRKVGYLVATGIDPTVVRALASGSIPVVVDAGMASAGDAHLAAYRHRSPRSAADEIRRLTSTGLWSQSAERARAEGRANQTAVAS